VRNTLNIYGQVTMVLTSSGLNQLIALSPRENENTQSFMAMHSTPLILIVLHNSSNIIKCWFGSLCAKWWKYIEIIYLKGSVSIQKHWPQQQAQYSPIGCLCFESSKLLEWPIINVLDHYMLLSRSTLQGAAIGVIFLAFLNIVLSL
jgi:hypothetical protein